MYWKTVLYFGLLVLHSSILTGLLLAQERFGGIELGAKGIKVSVIEIVDGKLSILKSGKKSVNANLANVKNQKFGDLKIGDVSFVVSKLKKWMVKELQVPAENIRVIASSGVPSFASDFESLVSEIESTANIQLEKITANEEAALTSVALVPVNRRSEVLVVDLGSGNTKGGFFITKKGTQDQFISFRLPFGTASLVRRASRQVARTPQSKRELIDKIIQQDVVPILENQIRSKSILKEKKVILLAGGSVWSMATFMKPETVLNPFPLLTAREISEYKKMLVSEAPHYPKVDLSKIKDPKVRRKARSDFRAIVGASRPPIFSVYELYAGSAMLNELSRSLEFRNRHIFFDRKATNAWITAKITPEKYRDQLPSALDRKFPQIGNTEKSSNHKEAEKDVLKEEQKLENNS